MTDAAANPTPILIAEDDPDIAAMLARGLTADGYAPVVAAGLREALDRAQAGGCVAAIVDMMLGADDGSELVAALRAAGMTGPILVLSALSAVEDRAAGLEAGADDYIAKPFDYDELLARLRVQERRRAQGSGEGVPLIGRMRFDPGARMVANGARSVILTQRESELLLFLARRPNRLCSRGEIFDALWLEDGGSSENVVDVYIGYLRKKLAPLEDFGVALRTIRARGFILTEI